MGEVRPECSDHVQNGWASPNANWVGETGPINFVSCPGTPGYGTACNNNSTWAVSMGFKSHHPGGAQFVFGDGSVRLLNDTMLLITYQILGSRNDSISPGDY